MTPEILSVSQLNRHVRTLLQQHIPSLWVAGEISNLTRAASGHLYFSLKDENAQIRCVMFRNRAQLIPWRLENGQQIEARAQVTLYEARGDFQLNIEAVRRAGLGNLYETYLRLRARLEAEGLFQTERKRPLPRFPRGIGIVTSPQAAALQDICTTLRRRAPMLPLRLYPSPVQGEGAGQQLAAAITLAGQRAAQDGIELLIVARGGGSLEDLWAFNEESVARALAACPLPTLSGVGHETDVTIADFVADQRAATPTAAAELASAGWFQARHALDHLAHRLSRSLREQLDFRHQQLDLLSRRLLHPGQQLARQAQNLAHLATRLAATGTRQQHQHRLRLEQLHFRLRQIRPALSDDQQRLDRYAQRLATASQQALAQRQSRLALLTATLGSLAPHATLARGYSILRNERGEVIRDVRQLKVGSALHLELAHGQAHALVDRLLPVPPTATTEIPQT